MKRRRIGESAEDVRRKRYADKASAASVLSSAGIKTSEDLIRFLKSSDGASRRTPEKAKIAWAAWAADDSVLFLPRKAETLADWLLNTICSVALQEQQEPKAGKSISGKASEDPDEALADLRDFLEEICKERSNFDGGGRKLLQALSAKHPILNHVQSLLKKQPKTSTLARWSAALSVLTNVLEQSPVQNRVAKFDQSLECLIAVFHLQTHFKRKLEDKTALNCTIRLENVLLHALLTGVENQVHAKKTSSRILGDEQVLSKVVELACSRVSPEQKLAKIFLIEVLFPFDTLRDMIGKELVPNYSSEERVQTVVKILGGLSMPQQQILPELVLQILPELVLPLVHRIRNKAAQIQASLEKVASRSMITGKLDAALRNSMLRSFIEPVLENILVTEKETGKGSKAREIGERIRTRAEQRMKFIQAISKAELYRAGTTDAEQGWARLLKSLLTSALDYVLEHPTSEAYPEHASMAASIWSMDSHLASESLQKALQCVLGYSLPDRSREASEQAEKLFEVILSASVRMRAMPEFIQRLSNAALSSFDALSRLASDPKNALEKLAHSPPFLGQSFRHAVRNSISPLQATEVIMSAAHRCLALLQQTSSYLTTAEALSDRSNGEAQIARVSLELELAAVILSEMQFPDALLEDLLDSVSDVVNHMISFVQGVQAYAPKRSGRRPDGPRTWQHDHSLFECSLLSLFKAITAIQARVEDQQTTIESAFSQTQEHLDKLLFAGPRSLDRDFASDHQIHRYCDTLLLSAEMHSRGMLTGSPPDLVPIVEYALLLLQPWGTEASQWDGKPLSMTSASDWRKSDNAGLPEAFKDLIYNRYISLLSATLPSSLLYRLATSLLDMLGASTSFEEKHLPREALAVRNAALLELAPFRQAILQAVSEKDNPGRVLALCHFPASYFEGNWQLICDAIQESIPSQGESEQINLRALQVVALQHGANLDLASFGSILKPITMANMNQGTIGSIVKLTSAWIRRQCDHLQGENLQESLKQLYVMIDDIPDTDKSKVRRMRAREVRLAFYETILSAIPTAAGAILPAPANFTVQTVKDALVATGLHDTRKAVEFEEVVLQVRLLRALGRFPETIFTHELAELIATSTQGAIAKSDLSLALALVQLLCVLDPKQQRAGQVTPLYYISQRARALGPKVLPGSNTTRTFYAQLAKEYQRSLIPLDLERYEEHLAWVMQILPAITREDCSTAFASFQTLSVLLRDGPSNSSDIFRRHFQVMLANCMSLHKVSAHFSRDFLPCIRNVVQNKVILLQHQHVELLLQVCANVVAPSFSDESRSTKSSSEDASPIFSDIVAILTTLIRQRRDLLQAFLPQLSQLLGSLTSLLRVPYAQLGGVQQRLVAEAFPAWLDPFEQCLGEQDARALSRLLTSITARTQTLALRSRRRDQVTETTDRTDFLSKPFARHATHVMVAYVRALIASPYMFIPNNVQRALEPGLFAMCEITSGHDRDAALVGLLDPAGRTLMKRIWSNWEAQRYKGQ